MPRATLTRIQTLIIISVAAAESMPPRSTIWTSRHPRRAEDLPDRVLRVGIVARKEDDVVSLDQGRVGHHLTVHRVERLHHARVGECGLEALSQ